jgi:hypothetical protein
VRRIIVLSSVFLTLLGCSKEPFYDDMLKPTGFYEVDKKVASKCSRTITNTSAQLFNRCRFSGEPSCKELRSQYLTLGLSVWDNRSNPEFTIDTQSCKATAGDQYAFLDLLVWAQYPLKVPPDKCKYGYRDVILGQQRDAECVIDPMAEKLLKTKLPDLDQVLRSDPTSALPSEIVTHLGQIPQVCLKQNVPYLNYNPCGISELWLLEYSLSIEKNSNRATQARLMFEATSGKSVEEAVSTLMVQRLSDQNKRDKIEKNILK